MIKRLNQYLNVTEAALKERGVFNGIVGVDTKVFLDPFLLKRLSIHEFRNSRKTILTFYKNIILLLKSSKQQNDIAWKEAYKNLKVREIQGVSVGYGNNSDQGRAIGPILAKKLTDRANEIVKLGMEEPEIFELIGLYEEDFGADRLSDITLGIIYEELLTFSSRITKELNIKKTTNHHYKGKSYILPINPEGNKPLYFLPEMALRDLPIANDWEEIDYASYLNKELRERLNSLVGKSWKKNIKASKESLIEIIKENPEILSGIVNGYKNSNGKEYDFVKDPNYELKWLPIAQKFAKENPLKISEPINHSLEEMLLIIEKIALKYKKLIEFNELNKELYYKKDDKLVPHHERVSQRLFYAVADCYCEANNLDINREPNAGSGAVDFKFSHGYARKVLVEIKLSKNPNLSKRYLSQLGTYEKSETANDSFYLVIQVTEKSKQLDELLKKFNEFVEKKIKVPKVIVIDGRLMETASKRTK